MGKRSCTVRLINSVLNYLHFMDGYVYEEFSGVTEINDVVKFRVRRNYQGSGEIWIQSTQDLKKTC